MCLTFTHKAQMLVAFMGPAGCPAVLHIPLQSYVCRFEAEESEGRPPCSFLPFGEGPRNCIGMKLARMMMKMALVILLHNHRFITTPNTGPVIQTKCSTLTACVTSDVFLDVQSR